MSEQYSVEILAQAIYAVNKHAKTAPDNRELYSLKKRALQKLISEKKAKKIGLHFVDRPQFSQQQSSVLISCADYYFHSLPQKEDFKALPHLGKLDEHYRNPIRHMGLKKAKAILSLFLGDPKPPLKKPIKKPNVNQNKKKPFLHTSSYFYGH